MPPGVDRADAARWNPNIDASTPLPWPLCRDGLVVFPLARLCAHGAEHIGEMQYEDSHRLAYIRGPEGIIVGLAEKLGKPEASPAVVRTRRPRSG